MNEKTPHNGLFLFLLIAFLWSWILWIPGILNSYGIEVPGIFLAIGMAAVFGPTFSALIVTALNEGKTGVKNILKRGISFNFNKKWLIPVLLLAPATAGLSFLVSVMVTGDSIAMPSLAMIPQLIIMFFVGGPLAEEFGWRGFALDKLLSRMGVIKASLLLGLIWGIWHLPLHFISGSVQEYIPAWAYILIICTSSVLFTWIYLKTERSIMAAMLFHWSVNLGNMVFPYWQAGGQSIPEDSLPNLWMPTSGMLIGFAVLLLTVIIVSRISKLSKQHMKN